MSNDLVNSLEDDRRTFGIGPKPIDTAARRLEAWAQACAAGATNVITVDGVSYSWDTHPRQLQNGALQGRVYAQPRGAISHDIGGYKIAAGGTVLKVPAALRSTLPGAAAASSSEDQGETS